MSLVLGGDDDVPEEVACEVKKEVMEAKTDDVEIPTSSDESEEEAFDLWFAPGLENIFAKDEVRVFKKILRGLSPKKMLSSVIGPTLDKITLWEILFFKATRSFFAPEQDSVKVGRKGLVGILTELENLLMQLKSVLELKIRPLEEEVPMRSLIQIPEGICKALNLSTNQFVTKKRSEVKEGILGLTIELILSFAYKPENMPVLGDDSRKRKRCCELILGLSEYHERVRVRERKRAQEKDRIKRLRENLKVTNPEEYYRRLDDEKMAKRRSRHAQKKAQSLISKARSSQTINFHSYDFITDESLYFKPFSLDSKGHEISMEEHDVKLEIAKQDKF